MTTKLCDICGERKSQWIDAEGIQICGLCGVLLQRMSWRDGRSYMAYPLRSVDGEHWFGRYRSN